MSTMGIKTMSKNSDLTPSRLRIARKIAGLSLEDLSRKIGGRVTRQALSKYERGRMSPSPEVHNRLVGVLDLTPQMFEPPMGVRESGIYGLEFRKSAALPKKKEEALKQIALEYLARYEELEKLLGRTIQFMNPIPGTGIRTVEEIENAAAAVRERWDLGLSPISNLLELLEANGIKIYEIRDMEGTKSFDGLAARAGYGFVMALNMNRPADRIRFTAAHELAHIVCDFNGAGEKERLCHVFAGALLLPRPALERELVHRRRKITLWELAAIKERYGISLQAIMHRARDLDLVTARHLREFQATIKKNGWSIDEPVGYRGREEAVRFKRLLYYAVAEKIIGTDQAAAYARMSEADFKKEIGTMI
jgi:Zn-dependent peptidase ImmA (M78 family)/DNA-binding XRE family transcriptional regulator